MVPQQPEEDTQDPEESDTVNGKNAYAWRPLPLWPGIEDPMEDFGGLPIPLRLKEALAERGIVQPSGIQGLAMDTLARGEHVILHAPTGGGKTLAYLLPMLARLQPTLHIGLQALILVPTAELAVQITKELRWLFAALCGPERVCWFNPQVPRELGCEVLLSRRALWDTMRQDTAVIVSTPGLILSELVALRWQAKKFSETLAYFMCGNLGCVMMDEVDALFPPQPLGRGKRNLKQGATERVLEFLFDVIRHRYRNRPVQLMCASATANSHKVNKTVFRVLASKWRKRRDMARRGAPVLIQHGERVDDLQIGPEAGGSWVEVPKGITHCLVTMSEEDEGDRFRHERLTLVSRIVKKLEGTVLVFVPEYIKLDAMVTVLHQAGLTSASKYRSALGLGQDVEQLADDSFRQTMFHRKKGHTPSMVAGAPSEFALRRAQELADSLAQGETRILVAKEDTVRGMDVEDVRHVVLFSLPAMAMQYMHLAGRTGRMGREGNVISIVSPLERKSHIKAVETSLGVRFCEWDVDAAKVSEASMLSDEPASSAEDEEEEAVPGSATDKEDEVSEASTSAPEPASSVEEEEETAPESAAIEEDEAPRSTESKSE